jgi:AraC-like DNA-binding protein
MASPPDRDHAASTDTKYSALREHEVTDYRGTAESLLPVSEASVTQLRPGPEPTNLEIFSSDKLSVMGLQHHAASVGVVVVKPECCAFMWWDGNEDCRINGRPVSHSEIYAQGAQDGFHAAGGARRTIGIAVRRNDLVDTLASLTGVGPEDVLLRRAVLKLSPEVAYRFRSDVDELLRDAIGQSRDGAAAVNLSEAIFGLLVDAYLRSPPVLQRDERPRQPEQIVRLAEERFFASQGAKVSLADLCAATGVSQSTLYHAFGVVCGTPPLAYFHKRRLTEARRALKRSPAYSGGVKNAALAAGLTELGRFSVEYRQLFGESPSATLSRNGLD